MISLDPSRFPRRLSRFVRCHARSWYPIKAYKYRRACHASRNENYGLVRRE